MITIAIQCHNFQHRLSWMLSSLQNQIGAPDITVDISCMKDAGTPTTEQIAAMYGSDRLHINMHYYPIETLQYRGLTRNDAIKRCKTDWLLFADCDMVYHHEYFNKLMTEVAGILASNPSKARCIFTAGRYSNDIDKANDMVHAEAYEAPIPHPWKRVDARLNKIKRGNVGAGYFQLISMIHCAHEGYYVDPDNNRDHAWLDKWAKANSDRQFRRRIGNVCKLSRWLSRNQIHINHNRDNGNGLRDPEHLTEQR